MIRLKNKGIAFGWATIGIIILIAAGAVLFTPLVAFTNTLIKQGGEDVVCTFSLFKGKSIAKCPVRDVKIFDNKVEVDGENFIKKGSKETEEMTKEALAKLLTMCLNRGGGLNSPSFNTENWGETEHVCLECFSITIDEDVGEINNLYGYLRDNIAKGIRSDKNFLDVLTKDPAHLAAYRDFGNEYNLAPTKGTFVFSPGGRYTVFFIGLKKGYIPTRWSQGLELFTLDIRGFFESDDTYFTYIVESNRFGEDEFGKVLCDRKVN